jgi:hypothetical protein
LTRRSSSSPRIFTGWQTRESLSSRYNLTQQPQAFVANALVNSALHQHGNDCLPLILLDGSIISEGRYPSREELVRLIDVEADESPEASPGGSSPNAVKLPVINNR